MHLYQCHYCPAGAVFHVVTELRKLNENRLRKLRKTGSNWNLDMLWLLIHGLCLASTGLINLGKRPKNQDSRGLSSAVNRESTRW